MADEPKKTRKRAVKKSAGVAEKSVDKKSEKKSKAAIPTPIFQAAPVAPRGERKKSDSDTQENENRRRRRRRGGKDRRRSDREEKLDTEKETPKKSSESKNEIQPAGEPVFKKRRRRRRSGAEDVTPGESVEDGVVTVVKVRDARPAQEKSSDRGRDRKNFDRRDRRDRFRDRGRDRSRFNEHREFNRDYKENRRRGTILTDAEFLARRESVDREMLVRQQGDRTQIAILEDNILVEHYVNKSSNISYVGNVYLGKVQNVLPSMEAAFVDIGKGRNAVLYAGEVNWDETGLADNKERKIERVLKTGQSVLVQVTKDPIGQKGARLTSQISLPGRYLVYVPGGGMSGISRRLPEGERNRLKDILKNLITDDEGVIVRTAAEGASDEELTRDVTRLKAQWEDIKKKSENTSTKAPALLYGEPDLAIRVIRDIFNEDFRKLTVQGTEAWDDIHNYLGHIAPELMAKVEKWTGVKDLFTENRVDEQLAKALDRKVFLPSGGSLVIDRTEAMVVIDVNTGKFIGKGGNLEETVTKNNLEAAEEIARQLRLRDLGGIIVIDFIDMVLESNREQVLRRLVECLGRDRTKHQVAEVTSLGLVQMTRKRVGQGLIEAFSTTCDSCGGRGIHVHMEPVDKKKLDREILPTGEVENSEDDSESDKSEEDSDLDDKRPRFGRRRRRAASTGVLTPDEHSV
jgi:ribonuclease E